MAAKRYRFGYRAACRLCDQDIDYRLRGVWTDRGGNRQCVAYKTDDGEIMQPARNDLHKPDPSA